MRFLERLLEFLFKRKERKRKEKKVGKKGKKEKKVKRKKKKEAKKEKPVIRVRDIMTKDLIKVNLNMSLSRVLGIFKKWKISGAPVFDGTKLVGEISKTDILKLVKKVTMDELTERDIRELERKRVKDVMKKPIGINEMAKIEKAIKVMRERNISRLFVFRKEKLVGIITRTDLMKGLIKGMSKEKIHTQIDEMVDIIDKKGRVPLEFLAERLKLPIELVEDWAKILEEQGMVRLEYPPVGNPIVSKVVLLEE
ncbi:MAG: CBS domain-containing protein [Candidatus Aenigmarchaeota archaeon]|nr:CBS domain-containing protein [Candidatus Aenigmarchaeota archaeon]